MKLPVLVVMAKQPIVGETKTRLCPPLTPEQAAGLYEALLKDSLALAAALEGVSLAVAITPPQALDYFEALRPPSATLLPVACKHIGECLDKALSRLLGEGHSKALAFNSDGPSLPPEYLRRAVRLLDEADVVLGPSEDGGYYLIGLKRPQPELFRGVAWSTARVTRQTLQRAEAAGLRMAQLPPWYDVDRATDLERLQAELESLPVGRLAHTRRFLRRHIRPSLH